MCYNIVMLPNLSLPAKSLPDALNALNHRVPLRREQIPTLFVERPDSPTPEIETELRYRPDRLKLLFVGHPGSGKSTELTYLSTRLADAFIAVSVPVYEIYQKPDINHTELIYAMNVRLLQEATKEEVVPRGVATKVWEDLLEHTYQRLRSAVFGEKPAGGEARREVTVKLAVLAAELETKIGTEDSARRQVRERYEGNIGELLRQMDDVTRKMEQLTRKRVLLLVDGLEKFDREDMKALFVGHARSLTEPLPAIIYAFPVGLRYTDDFTPIKQAFDQVYLLPNFPVKHRDGTLDDNGRERLAEIIRRRVDDALIPAEVLDRAVTFSGGHVKTLIQLMQQSVLLALVDKRPQVESQHLDEAIRRLRGDFMTLLSRQDLETLRAIRSDGTKDLVDATPNFRLLYNGSLLEYKNTRGPWMDVNPIVDQLLDVLQPPAAP